MIFKKKIKVSKIKLIKGKNLELIGIYTFRDEVKLIEMQIDETPLNIQFDDFYLGNGKQNPNSQAPYLEQFLDSTGTVRVSSKYGEMNQETCPTRFTFFLYFLHVGDVINTPYGKYSVMQIQSMPKRLESIIEFEEND